MRTTVRASKHFSTEQNLRFLGLYCYHERLGPNKALRDSTIVSVQLLISEAGQTL